MKKLNGKIFESSLLKTAIATILLLSFMVYLFAIFITKLEPAYEQQNKIIKADKKENVRLLSHNIKNNADSTKLIGKFKNTSDKKIELVKAIATFYRDDFTIIGTDISNITPTTILPKMKGSLK